MLLIMKIMLGEVQPRRGPLLAAQVRRGGGFNMFVSCMYTYVYVYIYIYMYTHTHLHLEQLICRSVIFCYIRYLTNT